MSVPSYDAVLFIGFGGPEKKEEIIPFLEIVTKGRGIPRERLEEVAHHYEHLGGKSPINEITRAQVELLRQELKSAGIPLPVYIGQRNWHPFLEDALRQMAEDGIQRAIGFSTGPQRSEASLERYINATEKACIAVGNQAPVIDYVNPWFDHPLFIEAIAARVQEAIDKNASRINLYAAPWVFVAHSIPCKMAKDSTYVPELQRTAKLVCEKLHKTEGSLAYSSRSGNPKEPWLSPDVCDKVRDLAQSGNPAVLLITIGFIADHVEVLFDQDVEAKEAADAAGIAFYRTQTVGTHPSFIRMMAEVIVSRIKSDTPQVEQKDSHQAVFQDGTRQVCVKPESPVCYCDPESQDPACCQWVKALSAMPLRR